MCFWQFIYLCIWLLMPSMPVSIVFIFKLFLATEKKAFPKRSRNRTKHLKWTIDYCRSVLIFIGKRIKVERLKYRGHTLPLVGRSSIFLHLYLSVKIENKIMLNARDICWITSVMNLLNRNKWEIIAFLFSCLNMLFNNTQKQKQTEDKEISIDLLFLGQTI